MLRLLPGASSGYKSQPVQRAFVIRLMTGNEEKTVSYTGKELVVKFK